MRQVQIQHYVIVVMALLLISCGTKNPNLQDPEGQALVREAEVSQRLEELQRVAIRAEREGRISTAFSRPIVEFTVSSLESLEKGEPVDVMTGIRRAWDSVDVLPNEPGTQTVFSLVNRFDETKTLAPIIDELLRTF